MARKLLKLFPESFFITAGYGLKWFGENCVLDKMHGSDMICHKYGSTFKGTRKGSKDVFAQFCVYGYAQNS